MKNNATLGDWEKSYSGSHLQRGRSIGSWNYSAVSLTSVACKQMKHVITGYLRQILEMCGWLYEGQHGFRPG